MGVWSYALSKFWVHKSTSEESGWGWGKHTIATSYMYMLKFKYIAGDIFTTSAACSFCVIHAVLCSSPLGYECDLRLESECSATCGPGTSFIIIRVIHTGRYRPTEMQRTLPINKQALFLHILLYLLKKNYMHLLQGLY